MRSGDGAKRSVVSVSQCGKAEEPVVAAASLARVAGVPVALKLESLQVTGSFKVRGAANRMLALSDTERARGVVEVFGG